MKLDTSPVTVKRFPSLNEAVTALSALLLVPSFGCLAWIRLSNCGRAAPPRRSVEPGLL